MMTAFSSSASDYVRDWSSPLDGVAGSSWEAENVNDLLLATDNGDKVCLAFDSAISSLGTYSFTEKHWKRM